MAYRIREDLQEPLAPPTEGVELTALEVSHASGVEAGANGSNTHIHKAEEQTMATPNSTPEQTTIPGVVTTPAPTIHVTVNTAEHVGKSEEKPAVKGPFDDQVLAMAQSLGALLSGATMETLPDVLAQASDGIGKIEGLLDPGGGGEMPDMPADDEEFEFSAKQLQTLVERIDALEKAAADYVKTADIDAEMAVVLTALKALGVEFDTKTEDSGDAAGDQK